MKPREKCPTCGQILSWPHIALSPMQHEIVAAIIQTQDSPITRLRNFTALGKRLGLNPALVRAQVHRINTKLSDVRISIINKPVRIMEIQAIRHSSISDYLPTI